MIKKNTSQIWQSINELGNILKVAYSVTDPESIKKQ